MQTALSSGTERPAEAQAGTDLNSNVRAQLADLQSSSEKSDARWKSIETSAASLRENIQSARTRLSVGRRVSDTVNRCIELIRPFAGNAAAAAAAVSNDTTFEQIAHRYTMQGEREIHERLTGKFQQDSQAAEAVSIPDQNTEFGENIELF
jgi:hypothetical protein